MSGSVQEVSLMIKKVLSLYLVFVLVFLAVPVLAEEELPEEEPAEAFRFSFTLSLNDAAFPSAQKDLLKGYADLFDALRFEGTWAHSLSSSAFDLHLSVIPLDPEAAPVSLRFYGRPDYVFISSPLLGEEKIVLSNISLLEFCAKTYDHLGIPLQYLAYLYPYTWEKGFSGPVIDWENMVGMMTPEGEITPEAVQWLIDEWNGDLVWNRAFEIMYRSLGIETGFDEVIRNFFSECPSYFQNLVTGGQGIRVTREGNRETWTTACGDFIVIISDPDQQALTVTLPRMESGYLPSYDRLWSFSRSSCSGHLALLVPQVESGDPDLVNLSLSVENLPLTWPVNCDSSLHFTLTGGLFYNFDLFFSLRGSEDGSLSVEVSLPSDAGQPGSAFLSLSGSLLPVEEPVTVPPYRESELSEAMDILRSNDVSLPEFLSKILPTFLESFLRFLFGIPTSSCQALLDTLTDSGVLNMVLGD